MALYNTIPKAVEKSTLVEHPTPKTASPKRLIAVAAVASFVIGSLVATAITTKAVRNATQLDTDWLHDDASHLSPPQLAYMAMGGYGGGADVTYWDQTSYTKKGEAATDTHNLYNPGKETGGCFKYDVGAKSSSGTCTAREKQLMVITRVGTSGETATRCGRSRAKKMAARATTTSTSIAPAMLGWGERKGATSTSGASSPGP